MTEKTYRHDWDDLDEMLGEIAQDPTARAAFVDAMHREVGTVKIGLQRLKVELMCGFLELPCVFRR